MDTAGKFRDKLDAIGNINSDGFDIDRHFAFLRDHEDETLLFVANFSDREARMKLRIPPHAFEWLELAPTPEVNPDTPVEVAVPPMDMVMICLSGKISNSSL